MSCVIKAEEFRTVVIDRGNDQGAVQEFVMLLTRGFGNK
jgi:hypothetical protein